MSKTKQPRPTDAELEILNVLYEKGPSTVREVYKVLSKEKPTLYTTVLKMMQIMVDKGLVKRDERERAHRYSARAPQEQTQRQLVNDLARRAFGGSALQLVMRALASKKASPEELAKIRALLDEMEGKKK